LGRRGKIMDILDFMEKAIRVEEILSECYRALSTQCEPRLVARMTGFSVDEVNHERILDLGKAFIASTPDLFGTAAMPEGGLDDGLRALRPLHEAIRSAHSGWQENLENLRELEMSLEQVHLAASTAIRDPTLRALFKGLSAGSQNHAAALEGILNEVPGPQPSAPAFSAAEGI